MLDHHHHHHHHHNSSASSSACKSDTDGASNFGFLDFIPATTTTTTTITTTAPLQQSSAAIGENKLLTCSSHSDIQSALVEASARTSSDRHLPKCNCRLSQPKILSSSGSLATSPSNDSFPAECSNAATANAEVAGNVVTMAGQDDIDDLSQLPRDSLGIPIPQTLVQLVRLIRLELGENGLMDQDKVNVPRLQTMMENYRPQREDWERYAFFDPYRYTRNLIDDGNGKYNLLLLCWGQQQCSPIHDHANAHCVLKVMQGSMTETRFAWPTTGTEGKPMQVTSVLTLQEGQAAYMHDEIGLHRVSNPSVDQPAVSLHLYSPPINMCSTFCEENGQARKSGNCVFFSVRGQRNIQCAAGLNS